MFYALSSNKGQSVGADLAYVVGVMLGDACVYRQKATHHLTGKRADTWRIELKVTDREFAAAFAESLQRILKRPERRNPKVLPSSRPGEHRVAVASKGFGEWWIETRFDALALERIAVRQPAAFLRGLYDSEGNLTWTTGAASGQGRGSYVARIFSTELPTLNIAWAALVALGLDGSIRVFRKPGTKVKLPRGRETTTSTTLYVLAPLPARSFLEVVGSNIPRKSLREL